MTFDKVVSLIQGAVDTNGNGTVDFPGGTALIANATLLQLDSTGIMIGRLSVLSMLVVNTTLADLSASASRPIDWCALSSPYTGGQCLVHDPANGGVYADATLFELALYGVPSSIVPVWDIQMSVLKPRLAAHADPKSPLAYLLNGDYDGDGFAESAPLCTTSLTLGQCLAEIITPLDFPWEDLPLGQLNLPKYALGERLPITAQFGVGTSTTSVSDHAAHGLRVRRCRRHSVRPRHLHQGLAGVDRGRQPAGAHLPGVGSPRWARQVERQRRAQGNDHRARSGRRRGRRVRWPCARVGHKDVECLDAWTNRRRPLAGEHRAGSHTRHVLLRYGRSQRHQDLRHHAAQHASRLLAVGATQRDFPRARRRPRALRSNRRSGAQVVASAPVVDRACLQPATGQRSRSRQPRPRLPPETLQDVPTAPTDVANPLLKAVAANRGRVDEMQSIVEASSTASTSYRIQVSAYGTSSGDFALRVLATPSGIAACPNKTFAGAIAAPVAVSGVATPSGLIVYNTLATSATLLGVNGDTSAQTLYSLAKATSSWLLPVTPAASDSWTAPQASSQFDCAPVAANAVVQAIADAIKAQKTGALGGVSSVVLVGGDDKLPFYRLPDTTTLSNEVEHSDAVGTDNPASASQRDRYFLSDDPYGTLNPIRWLDRSFNVPTWPSVAGRERRRHQRPDR